MMISTRGRATVVALGLVAMTACSNAGSLGNVLGSVLGGGAAAGNQLAGTIQGVDTQNQQIGIAQTNGQTVAIRYDNRTRVVYQNQDYPVTALENGDEVVARIRDAGNGSYYTDSVQVTRSVSNSGGNNPVGLQTFSGIVRQIDLQNGVFSIDNGSGYAVNVTLPYNTSQADRYRFEHMSRGEKIRFYGVMVNNTSIELRQFL